MRVTVAQRWLAHEPALRGEGASQGEVQAERECEFGPEAAARLAELALRLGRVGRARPRRADAPRTPRQPQPVR